MEQQLDQSLLRTAFSDRHFSQLLQRYAVVLLIAILVKGLLRQAATLIPLIGDFMTFSSMSLATIITAGTVLAGLMVNLITGLIILSDMRKAENVSWLVFFLTLLSNEAGVIFFLFTMLNQKSKATA